VTCGKPLRRLRRAVAAFARRLFRRRKRPEPAVLADPAHDALLERFEAVMPRG
jgi:hypothetical protein